MIPLQSKEPLKWTDEDGAVFEIAPAVGENELVLHEAMEKISIDSTPYLEDAEKIINEAWVLNPGCPTDEHDKLKAIHEKAYQIARSKNKNKRFSREELKYVYAAVNLFVLSCTPAGKEKIKFNGDAVEKFHYVQNMKLFNAISTVNYITDDDKKN